MRKKLLVGMIMLLACILLFLITPTVHAATYTVGAKTITFEKFQVEGIDEEIISVWDFKNNIDGILLLTETQKIYHMKLDGTVEEITWEEYEKLYDEGKLLEDYEEYCAYSDEEPEVFSQELPELTFVEGTGDNDGWYAVKIGEEILSDYIYSEDFEVITGDNWDIGNVIIGIGKNKTTNESDVWINTKTDSKMVTLNETDEIYYDFDYYYSYYLQVYTYNDEGNEQVIIYDWSGKEIMSLELAGAYGVDVQKINTYNEDFLEIDIYSDDGDRIEIYDLEGNKILETENDAWLYAYHFGILEYHSEEANTSKVIEIKNNTTISDVVETNYIELYATTAKLTKTSEDYLAPGKYYFVTYEEDAVYEMTISYTILNGANSSIDKTSEEDLTVKTDGDIEKLEGIYVNDEKLAEENYTVAAGSTIVTLKNEYLKTLEVGEYTLKVKYLDGEVETKYTITEEIKEDDTQVPGETPDGGNQGTGDKGEETTGSENDDTISPGILPNTGKITIISILLVAVIMGTVGFIKIRRYREI